MAEGVCPGTTAFGIAAVNLSMPRGPYMLILFHVLGPMWARTLNPEGPFAGGITFLEPTETLAEGQTQRKMSPDSTSWTPEVRRVIAVGSACC